MRSEKGDKERAAADLEAREWSRRTLRGYIVEYVNIRTFREPLAILKLISSLIRNEKFTREEIDRTLHEVEENIATLERSDSQRLQRLAPARRLALEALRVHLASLTPRPADRG